MLAWAIVVGAWLLTLVSVRFVVELASRRARKAPPPAPRETRSLTLLVDVDDRTGLVRPTVQIRGSDEHEAARLRLELVDDDGRVHPLVASDLPPGAACSGFALPAVTPPEGATVDDIVRWRWDLVLEDATGERGRWQERLAASGALNPEAELELPV